MNEDPRERRVGPVRRAGRTTLRVLRQTWILAILAIIGISALATLTAIGVSAGILWATDAGDILDQSAGLSDQHVLSRNMSARP